MATRLTSSRLRQIIQEERARLAPRRRTLREGKFSYSTKLRMLEDALMALQDVAQYEARESDIGQDPDLDALIRDLEGYMESVQAMAAEEDVPVEYPTSKPLPRSMRH